MNARYLTILAVLAVALGTASPVTLGSFAKMEPVPCGSAWREARFAAGERWSGMFVTTKQPKLFFMMLEGRLARIDVRIPGNNDHGNSGWRFGGARAASLRQ